VIFVIGNPARCECSRTKIFFRTVDAESSVSGDERPYPLHLAGQLGERSVRRDGQLLELRTVQTADFGNIAFDQIAFHLFSRSSSTTFPSMPKDARGFQSRAWLPEVGFPPAHP
jgi:hypothetical protein